MFSDTHFHFPLIKERNPLFDQSAMLKSFAQEGCFFAQDIGTGCSDLKRRVLFFEEAVKSLNQEEQAKVRSCFHFSAGIWPSPESIKDRFAQIKVLEEEIASSSIEISALGECGLDHHWNPSGADNRTEADFDEEMFVGERELFLLQIELAKKLQKPMIIHSRDAYEGTFDCIKQGGYDKGVIHCYAYGKEEAKNFLDRGWFISFCGNVTYTRKAKLESMKELLRYIPKDRLLLETDAPYLAPNPYRGQINTPLLIKSTYEFAADILQVDMEELCNLVDVNSKELFLK